ncbi:uncharacterized protein B0I36DRAFT_338166 [Microdochium trichocladiopsis]|uniref:Uncharacterized protein n=1 Tax=Microdochium trichocladiopsis TaxID=1682393 RepID=A0A9P8XTQ2_9PEZI|nr:uncharacterized protein B0I36DRAFT_338166 [Microdochium trichocladiopsis]KAH7016576.1 hypothetical protein B0I36DRAFT_338166 [Microdochium trichocladiopsis]
MSCTPERGRALRRRTPSHDCDAHCRSPGCPCYPRAAQTLAHRWWFRSSRRSIGLTETHAEIAKETECARQYLFVPVPN